MFSLQEVSNTCGFKDKVCSIVQSVCPFSFSAIEEISFKNQFQRLKQLTVTIRFPINFTFFTIFREQCGITSSYVRETERSLFLICAEGVKMRENMQIFSAQCRVGKKCPLFSVFARLFHFLRGSHKVYGKKITLIFFSFYLMQENLN